MEMAVEERTMGRIGLEGGRERGLWSRRCRCHGCWGALEASAPGPLRGAGEARSARVQSSA